MLLEFSPCRTEANTNEKRNRYFPVTAASAANVLHVTDDIVVLFPLLSCLCCSLFTRKRAGVSQTRPSGQKLTDWQGERTDFHSVDTAEIRFIAVRSPRFGVSGYCTK